MGSLLEVNHLKKYFRTPEGYLHAVDDVSFKIKEGETLGVVGESGCGKSTLGRTIIHLLEPTEGEIFFDGEDISSVSKKEAKDLRKNMQMIFQDPFSSLNPRKTLRQIISEPMLIYKTCGKNEIAGKVKELMDTVGLAQRFVEAYPHELDGGRRQRIGIARALALNPRFIVCDEPVSALDVSIQAQILNLMQDLQEERRLTYMFITHNLSVVKHISNEICVMYLGKILEQAPTKTLFHAPYHPYTKGLLAAIPRISTNNTARVKALLKGELSSPINPKPGCRFAPRCEFATDACRQQDPPLCEVEPDHFVACHRVKELNGLH